MNNLVRNIASTAKAIQQDVDGSLGPPEEGLKAPSGNSLIAPTLFRGTRGYLEKVANQANGAYSQGWYDASAVMARRLLETLIIEAFEKHGRSDEILTSGGDFLYLRDLIDRTIKTSAWNLSRNTKSALPRLKDIGDKSAHSRRFNAVRSDLEYLKADFRVVIEELLSLAGLR